MSRRHGNPTRRQPIGGCSSLKAIVLIMTGGILFLLCRDRTEIFGSVQHNKVRAIEAGDFPCTAELESAIPFLRKAYGEAAQEVLHVGPDSCSVVATWRKHDSDSEALGIEPYDVEEDDGFCKGLVKKGIVRVADIKFPLPYKAKSFSLVVVSDALDYLSPKYLNRTLPDLARISKNGLVVFTGKPSKNKEKGSSELKLRSASWWERYFIQTSLNENEAMVNKFKKTVKKASFKPSCQVFHLKPYH